jgi:hypothetical protein
VRDWGRESTGWQKCSPKVREMRRGRGESGELKSSQKMRWERSGGRFSGAYNESLGRKCTYALATRNTRDHIKTGIIKGDKRRYIRKKGEGYFFRVCTIYF